MHYTISTLLFWQSNEGIFLRFFFVWRTIGISKCKAHRTLRAPKEIFTVRLVPMPPPELHQNYHSNVFTILSLQGLLFSVWLSVCTCFFWFWFSWNFDSLMDTRSHWLQFIELFLIRTGVTNSFFFFQWQILSSLHIGAETGSLDIIF